jgi:predicted metal-dependent hydrolase
MRELCEHGFLNSLQYSRGITLFNQASFFACHEALEDAWRDAPESERKFLQGLIQIAVAFHHYSKGNSTGARSLLARALQNLAEYPEEFAGLELTPLRRSVAGWREALDNDSAPPLLPTLSARIVDNNP